MQKMSGINIYEDLVEQFQKGIAENNSKMLRDFLNRRQLKS